MKISILSWTQTKNEKVLKLFGVIPIWSKFSRVVDDDLALVGCFIKDVIENVDPLYTEPTEEYKYNDWEDFLNKNPEKIFYLTLDKGFKRSLNGSIDLNQNMIIVDLDWIINYDCNGWEIGACLGTGEETTIENFINNYSTYLNKYRRFEFSKFQNYGSALKYELEKNGISI